MDQKKINLKITTPNEVVFQDKIDYILLQTPEGEKGFLPNHENCMATLNNGIFTITKNDEKIQFRTAGGTIMISGNEASILSDFVAKPEEYDELYKSKTEMLSERYSEEMRSSADLQRAELALRRSLIKND